MTTMAMLQGFSHGIALYKPEIYGLPLKGVVIGIHF